MQPRVTAILVCANAADHLDRTLDALAAQTRPPESLVVVDIGSTDGSTADLAFGGSAQLTRIPAGRPFGEAVSHAEQLAPHGDGAETDEWLWLIGHDNAPQPTALQELLAAVEIAPSVAVAGPKLMEADQPNRIRAFGESMTRFGRSIALVEHELDQGQHDTHADVLGVAAAGMLVRRTVWVALGGFDSALPHVDAALDFCVRARLAGHRVSVVPEARVSSAGAPEDFGRRKSVGDARRLRLHRQAQLHRRMVYAPGASLWLHWLTLVPLAIVRGIGHLIAKHPAAVGAEFSAAFAVAFGDGVRRGRGTLSRNRTVGWAAIEPLRVSRSHVRERQTTTRDVALAQAEDAAVPRASFLGDGGVWVVLGAALLSVIVLFPLLGSPAVTGGGIIPLSTSVGQLWSNVGYGWHTLGTGFTGPSDPLTFVLAVIGTVTFWSPSTAVVIVLFLAMPLSALGAWLVARQWSTRAWVPVAAGVLYTLSPSLTAGITTGHFGAVIAHTLLPWLVLAVLAAHRSWAATAAAALLFAAITAGAPSLLPLLLVAWLAVLAIGWRHALRRVWIPIPAAVLFVPLVVAQLARGNPMAIFADPGVPSTSHIATALELAIGQPLPAWNGWLGLVGVGAVIVAIVVAALSLPLGLTAIGALLGRRWVTVVALLIGALLAYVTAFGATHLAVTAVGSTTTTVWSGSALSAYWLAIVLAACLGLDSLPRLAPILSVVTMLATAVTVAPLFAALFIGTAAIQGTTGRVLSAYVNAEAQANPDVGTLIIDPQSDGSLSVSLERGQGATLDDQSTLDATALSLTREGKRLTTLAGNLASRSGYDPRPDLKALGVSFILLDNASSESDRAHATHQRAAGAIGQNPLFTSIGDTAHGLLYHYDGSVDRPSNGGLPARSAHVVALIVIAVVFGATALLAIPTAPRRRRATGNVIEADEPATTFDEERE